MDINQLLKFNIFVLETQEEQRHTHLAELLMEIWAPKKQIIQLLPEQTGSHLWPDPKFSWWTRPDPKLPYKFSIDF